MIDIVALHTYLSLALNSLIIHEDFHKDRSTRIWSVFGKSNHELFCEEFSLIQDRCKGLLDIQKTQSSINDESSGLYRENRLFRKKWLRKWFHMAPWIP